MAEPAPSQVRALDEELLDDDALLEETQDPEPSGLRPSLRFFCTMAMVGVVLAFGWRYTGIAQQADQLWSLVISDQPTAPAGPKVVHDPLAPILAELNTLKSEVTRLTTTNQQMAATIASLQGQQRELQQRLASPYAATHLFSDPKLLRMHIVAGHRPLTTASTARTPAITAPARSEIRNRSVTQSGNAPLALAPPN